MMKASAPYGKERPRKKAELCCRSHPATRTMGMVRSMEISRVTEPAMSMILTSFGMHRGLRWNQVKCQFAGDIGVSRCDVHCEITKPFWMA
jgi:hypothetical protein